MTRRFLGSLLALLVAVLPLQSAGVPFLAGQSSKVMVASGTVTQANIRISAVDGVAFLDFSAATVLTGKLGHEVHVKDSSGNKIIGVIKAAGTGETLDGELVTNPGFGADTDWGHGVLYTIAAGVCSGDTTGNQNVSQEIALTTGWLYKAQITVTNHASGTHWLKPTSFSPVTTIAGNGTITAYATTGGATPSYFLFASGEFGVGGKNDFDNATFKHVLTPSATGVTIVTQKGGTTYNFAAKSDSFDYDDVGGYTYEIYKLWNAPVVASGNVAAANSHIDTTAANAFAWLNGVDLSAFQDGKHILGLYDSSGRARLGVISDTAPAGETLDGTEQITNGGFTTVSITFNTPTGTFAAGDTVTGVTSLASGTFSSVGGGVLVLTGVAGTFAVGETTAGVPSGATGVVVSQTPTGWPYYEATGASIAGGQAGNCAQVTATAAAGNEVIRQTLAALTSGALYKATSYGQKGTATNFVQGFSALSYGPPTISGTGDKTDTDWLTQKTVYATKPNSGEFFWVTRFTGATGVAILVDTVSVKQVTDPPSTAAQIVTAKGGAVRGWYYADANFDPNTASTYKVLYIGD